MNISLDDTIWCKIWCNTYSCYYTLIGKCENVKPLKIRHCLQMVEKLSSCISLNSGGCVDYFVDINSN